MSLEPPKQVLFEGVYYPLEQIPQFTRLQSVRLWKPLGRHLGLSQAPQFLGMKPRLAQRLIMYNERETTIVRFTPTGYIDVVGTRTDTVEHWFLKAMEQGGTMEHFMERFNCKKAIVQRRMGEVRKRGYGVLFYPRFQTYHLLMNPGQKRMCPPLPRKRS